MQRSQASGGLIGGQGIRRVRLDFSIAEALEHFEDFAPGREHASTFFLVTLNGFPKFLLGEGGRLDHTGAMPPGLNAGRYRPVRGFADESRTIEILVGKLTHGSIPRRVGRQRSGAALT